MNIVSEGSYRNGATSGLITTIAAGTASAGHLWAARWAPATNDARKYAVIKRLRATWFTVAGFTAAQEVQLQLFKLTGYTAAHTGGTAITPDKKQRSSVMPTPLLTGRIANTAELTNGTEVIATDPLLTTSFAELAAGATVPKGFFSMLFEPSDQQGGPLVLETGEGLLIRNGVLMGAGGTARVCVELDHLEVVAYPDKFTGQRLV
jgi:hypothetical protein